MKITETKERIRIPRDRENDYTNECAATRREFIQEQTGTDLSHLGALFL